MHCSADPELARALAPPVEKAITASVRRDPKPLADAIFPIIGPAIRKAVAASLAAMVESMNRTLEHSVSWRAIRWRLEARRTGRTFGEVVLLHTLLYRDRAGVSHSPQDRPPAAARPCESDGGSPTRRWSRRC